jgi:hypothetical protein
MRVQLKRKRPHTESAAEKEEATHRECSCNARSHTLRMQLKWKRPHTENAAEPKAATNREWLKRKKPHTESAAEHKYQSRCALGEVHNQTDK